MTSIAMRKLSAESKKRLRRRAESSGRSPEAPARSVLDQAAHEQEPISRFPHDLVAVVQPGEDIERYLEDHDEPQARIAI